MKNVVAIPVDDVRDYLMKNNYVLTDDGDEYSLIRIYRTNQLKKGRCFVMIQDVRTRRLYQARFKGIQHNKPAYYSKLKCVDVFGNKAYFTKIVYLSKYEQSVEQQYARRDLYA